MTQIMEALETQKKRLEAHGYTVAYICLYGSQNYELDINNIDYQSDIDMKAIVVPTLDDLVRNSKPMSTVVETEWGQCDIKDIRPYFQTLLKANPSYIETLFSKYYIVDEAFENEFITIFNKREILVDALKAQSIRAIYGMMCEKEKALCHPYPSIAHKIEKYGFDGKQLSHAHRLWLMMNYYYIENKPLADCFTHNKINSEKLIDMKLNRHSLEYAKSSMEEIMVKAKTLRDEVLLKIDEKTTDYSIKDEFLALSQDIIKAKIMDECA